MNYTRVLSEIYRSHFPGTAIYSNVDPSREWNGVKTIEFIETDAVTERFISGLSRRRIALAVAIRAETQDEATATGEVVKGLLVDVLDEIVKEGAIAGWNLMDEGTTPDARGVASGDSFYYYQDFNIIERLR